jgi:hypothetical protein
MDIEPTTKFLVITEWPVEINGKLNILWHTDPLLENDRERSSYVTAAT